VRTITNILMLQAAWFACVLGAARGHAAVGPILVAGLLAAHLWASPNRRRELCLIGASALIGTAADSLLMELGAISFATAWPVGWLVPVWMTALWMAFAATLNHSLGWLNGRYLLAAPLGAVSGALAYSAGAGLGAISLDAGWSLVGVGLEWALALPALLGINRFLVNPVRSSRAVPEAV